MLSFFINTIGSSEMPSVKARKENYFQWILQAALTLISFFESSSRKFRVVLAGMRNVFFMKVFTSLLQLKDKI